MPHDAVLHSLDFVKNRSAFFDGECLSHVSSPSYFDGLGAGSRFNRPLDTSSRGPLFRITLSAQQLPVLHGEICAVLQLFTR
jgi:hypothetical protein